MEKRMEKIVLLGKTPEELKEIAVAAGLPQYAGKQIARWLYVRRARSIDEMTDLSKAGRESLKERAEVGVIEPESFVTSTDGTRKYLFKVRCRITESEWEESFIEAVMIPDGERKTLCVSSEAGCKMGCRFCMTGRQGFHGYLSARDILSQILSIEESADLTNVVFMGMGEPLDNYEEVKRALDVMTEPWGLAWSPKRVTVSTIGVIPTLKRFLDESRCHLAVSLHDPFPEERASLMPVEKAYPLKDILALIRRYDFTGQRRVSFEYTMFSGLNDSLRHADELARLLRGLECRVNLIRFHKIPDFDYYTSSPDAMEAFRERLERRGVTATIRASRGEDIFAACGLLAGQHGK